jgi:hypothetical protein
VGSIPYDVTALLNLRNPSSRTMTLGSTQPVAMVTRICVMTEQNSSLLVVFASRVIFYFWPHRPDRCKVPNNLASSGRLLSFECRAFGGVTLATPDLDCDHVFSVSRLFRSIRVKAKDFAVSLLHRLPNFVTIFRGCRSLCDCDLFKQKSRDVRLLWCSLVPCAVFPPHPTSC